MEYENASSINESIGFNFKLNPIDQVTCWKKNILSNEVSKVFVYSWHKVNWISEI